MEMMGMVIVVLVVTLGLLASPVAAADGDGLLDGDDGIVDSNTDDSSSQDGGSVSVTCDADQSGEQECENEQTVDGGSLGVATEGEYTADSATKDGSVGESLDLQANDRTFSGEITCKLSPDTRSNPCANDYTAPGGGDGGVPVPPSGDMTIDQDSDVNVDSANRNASVVERLRFQAMERVFGGALACEVSPDTRSNPCKFGHTAPDGGDAPISPPVSPPVTPPEPPVSPPVAPPGNPGLPALPELPGHANPVRTMA